MKKTNLLIGLLILMVLVGGCIPKTEDTQEKDDYDYALDHLIIKFNGLTKEGVTAVTSINRTKNNPGGELNSDFKNYLSNDLNSITQKIEGIEHLAIHHWYITADGGSIFIEYKKESDINQYELLNLIKEELENRWYTKEVFFDFITTTY